MKLLHFDDWRIGVLRGDQVVDVTELVDRLPHGGAQARMNALIAHFDDCRVALQAAVASGPARPLAGLRLRPPLPCPRNIVCMAVNYMEDGTRSEPAPINAFHKAPSAIIGPGDSMRLPDVPATIFEGEAELALVIGRRASHVAQADAMAHVFGYVNFIDGSARGLPPANNSFFQMKSRDSFAPIGPYLVTADEIPDPHALSVRLWVNGEIKQDFHTSDMAHRIPRCIEWLSSIHALEPGDLLATGTNHRGLSAFMDGDRIELEVEHLGRLAIHVQDPLQRTWSRDTRLQHEQKGLPGRFTTQLTGKYAPAGG